MHPCWIEFCENLLYSSPPCSPLGFNEKKILDLWQDLSSNFCHAGNPFSLTTWHCECGCSSHVFVHKLTREWNINLQGNFPGFVRRSQGVLWLLTTSYCSNWFMPSELFYSKAEWLHKCSFNSRCIVWWTVQERKLGGLNKCIIYVSHNHYQSKYND